MLELAIYDSNRFIDHGIDTYCRETATLRSSKGHLWEQDFLLMQRGASENVSFKCQMSYLILSSYGIIWNDCVHTHQTESNNMKSKLQLLFCSALWINCCDNKQWTDCVLIPSVYYCMWLMVMFRALIYRWAGGSAEKDVYKMDQFPLGKGKRLVDSHCYCQYCIVPLHKHWGCCCRFKTSNCFSPFSCFAQPHFMWHCSISKTHCWAGHGTDCVS